MIIYSTVYQILILLIFNQPVITKAKFQGIISILFKRQGRVNCQIGTYTFEEQFKTFHLPREDYQANNKGTKKIGKRNKNPTNPFFQKLQPTDRGWEWPQFRLANRIWLVLHVNDDQHILQGNCHRLLWKSKTFCMCSISLLLSAVYIAN